LYIVDKSQLLRGRAGITAGKKEGSQCRRDPVVRCRPHALSEAAAGGVRFHERRGSAGAQKGESLRAVWRIATSIYSFQKRIVALCHSL
jgi:hypothetical protein